jgi:8-oxo-dGTP pyrophosphatase MutT (NUDIX family)
MAKLQLFKIAVSAFIVKNNKLLILKRADDEAFLPGTWEVPGGGIDEGESIEEGVMRETMEEAGIHVNPKRFGIPPGKLHCRQKMIAWL